MYAKDISMLTLKNHSVQLDKIEADIMDMTSMYWDDEVDDLYEIIENALVKLKGIINANIKEKEQVLIEQEKVKERKPRAKKK